MDCFASLAMTVIARSEATKQSRDFDFKEVNVNASS
jgi:hypothetical protein